MSKEEDIFARQLIEMFPRHQIIRNWRPNDLKNKQTDKNLELDFYLGKYRLGFEYQGGVHFKNIKSFKNDADKSRRHDSMKYEILEENYNSYIKSKDGIKSRKSKSKKIITIIEVFDVDLKGNFRDNIIMRMNNSREYYLSKNLFHNAINITKALCFLNTGVKYRDEDLKLGNVPQEYINKVREISNSFGKYKYSQLSYEERLKIQTKKKMNLIKKSLGEG